MTDKDTEIQSHNAAIDVKRAVKMAKNHPEKAARKASSSYPKTTTAFTAKYEIVRHKGQPVINDGAVFHRRLADGLPPLRDP